MSVVMSVRDRLLKGGASLRRSSRLRRLLGGAALLALLVASPARIASAQPVPSTPTDAIALLKWCWENRDIARYHELFADNFQYYYDAGNPAGVPYQQTPWSRADELVSSSNLFLGGPTPHAPASSVALTFTNGPTFQPSPGGRGFPWHQQFTAQWNLDITCADGSTLHGEGSSKWNMVRGDSAAIPQELKDRGFLPDANRWYIESWEEQLNTAPYVRAPLQASAFAMSPMTVKVSAQDPDGEAISSLWLASNIVGEFSTTADHSAGTLLWTPLPTDVGPHDVSFKAGNSLIGSAYTTINVMPANIPPSPSLVVTTPGGPGSLSVIADASGSTDPDGHIVSYAFKFGDGATATQTTPTAPHTYAAGGTYSVSLSVTDDVGAAASVITNVTVIGTPVASLSVTPATVALAPGGTQQLTATPKDAGGNPLTGRIVTWVSDNTVAVKVSAGGLVSGYAVGSANVTATCEGKSGASVVTVAVIPVASVSVSHGSVSLEPGTTKQLTATPKDASGNALSGRTLTWASDNTAAATVSATGLVSAIAVGTATVTASCEGKSGVSNITVTLFPVASVLVTPAAVGVTVGTTQQLTATPMDASGNALIGHLISWASDNTAAATVNSSGLVSGIADGTANVTATCEGKSGASVITVTTITDPIALLPNLVTNPSFETDTTGWQTFAGSTIERVAGGYDGLYAIQMTGTSDLKWGFGINDHPDWIHPTTAAGRRYRFTAHVRSDANHGLARIRVREYLLSSGALLGQISTFAATLTPTWQTLVVDYTTLSAGSSLDVQVKETPLVAGEVFLADDISIRDITGLSAVPVAAGEIETDPSPPISNPVLSFQAAVYPSPVQSIAVLTFTTTRPGALRVDLVDLAGRSVRRLDYEMDAPAGGHALTIDGMRDDGQRMSPGMYFYRIVADEGRKTGRFVMLR
jgi:uncharacterized protein YjdB